MNLGYPTSDMVWSLKDQMSMLELWLWLTAIYGVGTVGSNSMSAF